jgi:prevent-host-death family protein
VVDQHKVMKKLTLSATKFRSGCHRLLNDVAKGAYSIVITKRGKPVARVEAIHPRAEQGPLKGRWAGLAKTKGDIVYFDSSADWQALR